MGMFSEQEIVYLGSQRLARIGTVSPAGQPDVAPVSFTFEGSYFLVGGANPTRTLKYLNVQRGNSRIALVIDDLEAVEPWKPRGIKIHGRAAIIAGGVLRITPIIHWSWGIEGPVWEAGSFVVKKVKWPDTEQPQ